MQLDSHLSQGDTFLEDISAICDAMTISKIEAQYYQYGQNHMCTHYDELWWKERKLKQESGCIHINAKMVTKADCTHVGNNESAEDETTGFLLD